MLVTAKYSRIRVWRLNFNYLRDDRFSCTLLHHSPLVKVNHDSAVAINEYASCDAVCTRKQNKQKHPKAKYRKDGIG
jgi:hypothetical protein